MNVDLKLMLEKLVAEAVAEGDDEQEARSFFIDLILEDLADDIKHDPALGERMRQALMAEVQHDPKD